MVSATFDISDSLLIITFNSPCVGIAGTPGTNWQADRSNGDQYLEALSYTVHPGGTLRVQFDAPFPSIASLNRFRYLGGGQIQLANTTTLDSIDWTACTYVA